MTRNDPLNLFPENGDRPQDSGGDSGLGWALIGVLLGVVLLIGYQRMDWGGGDRRQDGQEQNDGAKVEAKGYLIFVHERKPLKPSTIEVLDMAREYCDGIDGLEMRSIDDDDTSEPARKVIEFAASKGIQPPCVVFRPTSGSYRSASKFPTNLDEIKAAIK